jgi:hypothetical protein
VLLFVAVSERSAARRGEARDWEMGWTKVRGMVERMRAQEREKARMRHVMHIVRCSMSIPEASDDDACTSSVSL